MNPIVRLLAGFVLLVGALHLARGVTYFSTGYEGAIDSAALIVEGSVVRDINAPPLQRKWPGCIFQADKVLSGTLTTTGPIQVNYQNVMTRSNRPAYKVGDRYIFCLESGAGDPRSLWHAPPAGVPVFNVIHSAAEGEFPVIEGVVHRNHVPVTYTDPPLAEIYAKEDSKPVEYRDFLEGIERVKSR